jgi:hypothetical protein
MLQFGNFSISTTLSWTGNWKSWMSFTRSLLFTGISLHSSWNNWKTHHFITVDCRRLHLSANPNISHRRTQWVPRPANSCSSCVVKGRKSLRIEMRCTHCPKREALSTDCRYCRWFYVVVEVFLQVAVEYIQELNHNVMRTHVILKIISINFRIEKHYQCVKRRTINISRNWWSTTSARLARMRLLVG